MTHITQENFAQGRNATEVAKRKDEFGKLTQENRFGQI